LEAFLHIVHEDLLPSLQLESDDPHEPVVVRHVPGPWKTLGVGNYAAVFAHPGYPDLVVKLYAEGRDGWEDEVRVYERLGKHPAYAECYKADRERRYLVLRRLRGVTFYECLRHGIRIPVQAVRDIDDALDYARSRGLYPHDVHGKNVMVGESGRGRVVDVSDFLKNESCNMWRDLKKAYYRIYLPFIHDRPSPLPDPLLNGVRRGYRLFRKGKEWFGSDS
jgi:hypothetical protein